MCRVHAWARVAFLSMTRVREEWANALTHGAELVVLGVFVGFGPPQAGIYLA